MAKKAKAIKKKLSARKVRSSASVAKKVVKKKPTNEQLIDSMEGLTKVMKEMVKLFKSANRQMISGEDPISNRLDELERQNQKIAKGVLAVAELVKKDQEEVAKLQPFEKAFAQFENQTFGQQHPGMPMQQMPGPQQQGPQQAAPMPGPQGPMPQPRNMAAAFGGPTMPEFNNIPKEEPIKRLPAQRLGKDQKLPPPPPSIPPR
jgi:hypothetical protein